MFSSPVRARFVRLLPTEWNNHISMRFEVLGCDGNFFLLLLLLLLLRSVHKEVHAILHMKYAMILHYRIIHHCRVLYVRRFRDAPLDFKGGGGAGSLGQDNFCFPPAWQGKFFYFQYLMGQVFFFF